MLIRFLVAFIPLFVFFHTPSSSNCQPPRCLSLDDGEFGYHYRFLRPFDSFEAELFEDEEEDEEQQTPQNPDISVTLSDAIATLREISETEEEWQQTLAYLGLDSDDANTISSHTLQPAVISAIIDEPVAPHTIFGNIPPANEFSDDALETVMEELDYAANRCTRFFRRACDYTLHYGAKALLTISSLAFLETSNAAIHTVLDRSMTFASLQQYITFYVLSGLGIEISLQRIIDDRKKALRKHQRTST